MALTERQQESVQRLAERMQFERMMRTDDPIEPVNLGTRIMAGLLLALASPASVLPIFAMLALLFAIITSAVGVSAVYAVAALLVVFWVVGFLAARAVANSWRQRRLTGSRRWWPLLATLSALGLTAWELWHGGNVDVIIFAWVPVGLWWSFAMLLSLSNWTGVSAARWFVLPLCVMLIASARVTHGYFEYRFDRSVDQLTAAATARPRVSSGTYGSFDILLRRYVPGCVATFKIDGWWVDDKRTIAYCPDGFSEASETYYSPTSLGHDWYEIGFFTN